MMDLANTSPKQLRELSRKIAESDDTLTGFLSSLQNMLLAFPVDKGAFRDEIKMIGEDLSRAGVLKAAGPSRIAHAVQRVSTAVVEIFLEGVDEKIAQAIRREIKIAAQMAADSAGMKLKAIPRDVIHIAAEDHLVTASKTMWNDLVLGHNFLEPRFESGHEHHASYGITWRPRSRLTEAMSSVLASNNVLMTGPHGEVMIYDPGTGVFTRLTAEVLERFSQEDDRPIPIGMVGVLGR
jgi:hypothetical protein